MLKISMVRNRSVVVALALVSVGCAGVDYKPVSQVDDPCAEGFRYYEPAVYLLAYSDGAGGIKTQIRVMPDQTRMMAAKPYANWSKLESELNFDHGMLANSSTVATADVVPAQIGEAIKTLAPAIASAIALADEARSKRGEVPGPVIFKLVPGDEPGSFTFFGSEEVDPIHVNLPRPK